MIYSFVFVLFPHLATSSVAADPRYYFDTLVPPVVLQTNDVVENCSGNRLVLKNGNWLLTYESSENPPTLIWSSETSNITSISINTNGIKVLLKYWWKTILERPFFLFLGTIFLFAGSPGAPSQLVKTLGVLPPTSSTPTFGSAIRFVLTNQSQLVEVDQTSNAKLWGVPSIGATGPEQTCFAPEDCVSTFSAWSACSPLCTRPSSETRSSVVVRASRFKGTPCMTTLELRNCSVPLMLDCSCSVSPSDMNACQSPLPCGTTCTLTSLRTCVPTTCTKTICANGTLLSSLTGPVCATTTPTT